MKVVLYTKTNCRLCVDAEDLLRSLQQSIRFELELVYIEDEESLLESIKTGFPLLRLMDGRSHPLR